MKQKLITPGAIVLAGFLLAACATSQTQTEATFGDAVRATTHAQIHDPISIVTPQKEAVTGGDPYALGRVVIEHRAGGGSEASSVAKPISISVSGSSSD